MKDINISDVVEKYVSPTVDEENRDYFLQLMGSNKDLTEQEIFSALPEEGVYFKSYKEINLTQHIKLMILANRGKIEVRKDEDNKIYVGPQHN